MIAIIIPSLRKRDTRRDNKRFVPTIIIALLILRSAIIKKKKQKIQLHNKKKGYYVLIKKFIKVLIKKFIKRLTIFLEIVINRLNPTITMKTFT